MILIYYVLLYVYVYSHFIYKTAVSRYLDQTRFYYLSTPYTSPSILNVKGH